MSLRLASRLDRLGTESAFEVLARARRLEAEGRDVIHLEIGEPDFATPDNITGAAVAALRGGHTHYTPASGLWEVRESVARYVRRRTGTPTGPENVVLVPGTKNLLLFALWSLVEDGDEVVLPDPGYPIYRSLVEFVGARAVALPLRESRDFRLDVAELEARLTPRTRAVIVNSPANPTGGALTRGDCEALARLCIEHDLFAISDEIYARLVYEGDHHSLYGIPGMGERTLLIDGLSKAWAMCGWRLGFGAMPVELARRMDTLMINTSSCAASFTQLAAVEAFEAPESDAAVDAMRAEFHRRRDLIVAGLNRIPGVRCRTPAGAFYAFANIEGTGRDEQELARELLDEVGVAVLPGSAFGPMGRGFLRLSYANSVDSIERALDRIGSHLGVAEGAR